MVKIKQEELWKMIAKKLKRGEMQIAKQYEAAAPRETRPPRGGQFFAYAKYLHQRSMRLKLVQTIKRMTNLHTNS